MGETEAKQTNKNELASAMEMRMRMRLSKAQEEVDDNKSLLSCAKGSTHPLAFPF